MSGVKDIVKGIHHRDKLMKISFEGIGGLPMNTIKRYVDCWSLIVYAHSKEKDDLIALYTAPPAQELFGNIVENNNWDFECF